MTADSTPSIVLEDGVAVLHWPGPDPSVIAVHREVFEDYASVVNELAALKARRCDGCVWAKPLDASSLWVRGGHDMRRCDVQTQVEAPMLSDCTPRTAKWQEIVVRADHACNAWTAKEPT